MAAGVLFRAFNKNPVKEVQGYVSLIMFIQTQMNGDSDARNTTENHILKKVIKIT